MKKTIVFDETNLLNNIDEMLINLDYSVLLKARKKMIKEKQSTEIIDKALSEKRRREKALKKSNIGFFDILLAVLFGLISSVNREKTIENDPYDDSFEEEFLEEDDYYYEDD